MMSDMSPANYEKRLREIDIVSQELAQQVSATPASRKDLTARAKALDEELLRIATTLKKADPAQFDRFSEMISESMLDLDYVLNEKTLAISLRLGRKIQRDSR